MNQIPERFRLENGDLDIHRFYRVQDFKRREIGKLTALLSLPANLPIIIFLVGYIAQLNDISIAEILEIISYQVKNLGIQK